MLFFMQFFTICFSLKDKCVKHTKNVCIIFAFSIDFAEKHHI